MRIVDDRIADQSAIQYAEVEISSAEILALHTTPKTLVAAPGVNKILEFISLSLAMDWDSVAYTINDARNLAVRYTDADGEAVSSIQKVTDFLDQESDQVRLLLTLPISGVVSIEAVPNAPLVLTLTLGNGTSVTLGDSPIHAKVAYRVHATGL
ncbi:hypothetical protein ES703_41189 [subsurface metagenome]